MKIKSFFKTLTSVSFFLKRGIKNQSHLLTYDKLIDLLSQDSIKNDENLLTESNLLKNILLLNNKRVQDIITPRVDIVAFSKHISVSEMLMVIESSGFSRFPIFKDSLDDIIGFFHVKDLLPYIHKLEEFILENVIREILFISPYMKILDLLYEMKIKRIHIAIIIDEFGGVDGMISIEDVVEEIVGDISDEHDKIPSSLITDIKDNEVIKADARIELDKLEEITGNFLTSEEKAASNTLGGLIVYLLGYIPAKNELILHNSGIEFRVISVTASKVNTVIITYSKLGKDVSSYN